MYSNIHELPSQVTTSLDERDAKAWMEEYNKNIGKDTSEKGTLEARRKAWESVKTSPSSFSFCIKASVEAVDKDREVIDVDSIKRTLDPFILHGGNVINEHGNYVVGCIWGWDPITEEGRPGVQVWGNLFGGDQVYDMARKAFIRGRNNLSVAGEATAGKFQCDELGCYTRRNVSQLLEISLCDVPANPKATMVWYNQDAKLTKSSSVAKSAIMNLNVNSYTLHKDYTACPTQAVKKSLLDDGYSNVHAREDGVHLYLPAEDVDHEYYMLFMKGYDVSKCPEGLLVNSRESRARKTFEGAFKKGYIDKTGLVKRSIPREAFMMLWDTGFLSKSEGGVYRFQY